MHVVNDESFPPLPLLQPSLAFTAFLYAFGRSDYGGRWDETLDDWAIYLTEGDLKGLYLDSEFPPAYNLRSVYCPGCFLSTASSQAVDANEHLVKEIEDGASSSGSEAGSEESGRPSHPADESQRPAGTWGPLPEGGQRTWGFEKADFRLMQEYAEAQPTLTFAAAAGELANDATCCAGSVELSARFVRLMNGMGLLADG